LISTKNGEFINKTHWQEITRDIFNKQYAYRKLFLQQYRQVSDDGYSQYYGVDLDDISEAPAPPKKVIIIS
jgi:hypothetical protein